MTKRTDARYRLWLLDGAWGEPPAEKINQPENSMSFTGTHSPETKQKISEAKRGKPHTEEHKAKIREAHRARNELIKQLKGK